MISVIIPTYNEEQAVSQKSQYYKDLSKDVDLIFVDGGSSDNTLKYISQLGRVVKTSRNRALQMNQGAQTAKSNILLFLHADAMLEKENITCLEDIIIKQGYIGGCFRQVYDHPGLVYKWIAWTGNARAKVFKIFYGDQGIFVRKDIFDQIGGYPQTSLCEDVLFTKKLKNLGKVGMICVPITCSARRWIHSGILKTFINNMKINWALAFGGNLNHLAKDYKDVRED